MGTLLTMFGVQREVERTFVGKRCHINVLEAKAFLLHEKRIALRTLPMKVPFALDSQVCLGMLVKGRSSAPALNRQLRSSLSYATAGGVFGHYLYFPSACNRADGPTRDSEPAPPDMLAPAWLQLPCYDKFCEGLDDWQRSMLVLIASSRLNRFARMMMWI